MKDAVVQAMCKPFDVDIQASEDAIVFLNGEFWGYHRIRERYDNEYLQQHYDLETETDAVIIQITHNPHEASLSEGIPDDLEDFNSKIYYLV